MSANIERQNGRVRGAKMKKAVIIGAGQMGRAAYELFNQNSAPVAAFGDNNPASWDYDAPVPVLPVKDALELNPDVILIGVLDGARSAQMQEQLSELRFRGRVIPLSELYGLFDIRGAILRKIAARIRECGVDGDVAELGVYRGDFAWQLNALFPERRLCLFDTFEGFDGRDISAEPQAAGKTAFGDFSGANEADVLARMPHADSVKVFKGRFPDTAANIGERRFALVSVDADLFAPTLAGLEYFYPRLNSGGAILLHDYNSGRFDGIKKAVLAYEKSYGALPLLPLCDLHGTAVILKP